MKKYILIFTFLFGISGVAQADLNDGLVAYYPFNGNANDESGNGYHGDVSGATLATDRSGKTNSAYNFDGKDDFIDIGNIYNFNTEIAFSGWFRLIQDGKWNAFFTKNTYCDLAFMYKGFDDQNYSKTMRTFNGTCEGIRSYDYDLDLPLNTWFHIVFQSDGAQIQLYLDGQKVNSFNYSSSLKDGSNFYIGATDTVYGFNYIWNGTIDDIRIYNRALSETEIQQLYNEVLYSNKILGKIVTSSEILGYTASVGGATIKALPYSISSTTNIYGEFELTDIPDGECIIQIESSYFQTLTKSIIVDNGENIIDTIKVFKPKCQNMYTQQEVDQLLNQIQSEKNAIITEKEATIAQLNTSIASMYSQGYLDKAIIEAEKRGELKYDINNDGKVGLEEIIKYLETLSGVRLESIIIFPEDRKYFLSE